MSAAIRWYYAINYAHVHCFFFFLFRIYDFSRTVRVSARKQNIVHKSSGKRVTNIFVFWFFFFLQTNSNYTIGRWVFKKLRYVGR